MFFSNFPKTKYRFDDSAVQTVVVDLFRYVNVRSKMIDDANSYRYYEIHDGTRPDVISYKLYNRSDYYWTFFIINDHLRTGMSGWPLSTQNFEQYMNIEYEGVVINARPSIVYDSDGLIIEHRDSIADRFKIGETITGLISGATGQLHAKDIKNNQIVLGHVEGTFQVNEAVRGSTTSDFITSYQVFNHDLAPKYYMDANGRVVANALFIAGGTPNPDCTVVTNREYEEEANDERSRIRVIRPDYIEKFVREYKKLINS